MKSILYQLSKYTEHGPDPEPVEIEVKESVLDERFDARRLAADLGCDLDMLYGMPWTRWVGILYPIEVLGAYWLSAAHGHNQEGRCDRFLMGFMRAQDKQEYAAKMAEAIDDTVKQLIACRALLATFPPEVERITIYARGRIETHERKVQVGKMDQLPVELRADFCAYLGLRPDSSVGKAYDKLEIISRSASIEQNILARIGYLMMWKMMSEFGGTPAVMPLGRRYLCGPDNLRQSDG